MINVLEYDKIKHIAQQHDATLIAVSKTKSKEAIQELLARGHKDFGENYVQELREKQDLLQQEPIAWHFIGHLQGNKIKYILPYTQLIQGVDSFKLLQAIQQQAKVIDKVQAVLLQVHIAQEETKFGFNQAELEHLFSQIMEAPFSHIHIEGMMGMASFTNQVHQVAKEFKALHQVFKRYQALSIPQVQMKTLSMGMSADYEIALDQGSNMIRIGSLLFGERARK